MTDERFQSLLEGYFDRVLSSEDRKEFEEVLRKFPERRAEFWREAEWHALFCDWAVQDSAGILGPQPEAICGPVRREARPVRSPVRSRVTPVRRQLWHGKGLVILLALLIAIAAGWEWTRQYSRTAPTLATVEAEWNSRLSVGSPLRKGPFELLNGVAQIRFASGATMVVQAPAQLDIVGPSEISLRHGNVMIEAAGGFLVETPQGRVHDLGTRFGVAVEDANTSETHVFSGRVEVSSAKQQEMLTAGQAVSVAPPALTLKAADVHSFPTAGGEVPVTVEGADFENPTLARKAAVQPGVWTGDRVRIAKAEEGIQPHGGHAMIELMPHEGGKIRDGADLLTLVDLHSFQERIAEGGVVAEEGAWFNCVGAKVEANARAFVIPLRTLSEAGAVLSEKRGASQRLGAGWQDVVSSCPLPADTAYLLVHLSIDASAVKESAGRFFVDDFHLHLRLPPRVATSAPAASISRSVAMPVPKQAVILTVSSDLRGNDLIIEGPTGTATLSPDAQGQVTWVPARYGKYTLRCGAVMDSVWVTAKPLIFHWWDADLARRNVTIAMSGTNAMWRSRGVKSVSWAGGEAYSRGVDGHRFKTVDDWLNNWAYGRATDGIVVDQLNAPDRFPTDQIIQAMGMIPRQWGANYSLGVYFSGLHSSGFEPDVAILKAANAYCLLEDYWGGYDLHVSRWAAARQQGLQDRSVLVISPNFYISETQCGPKTEAEVREQFRQVRLAAPEAPGIGIFNAFGSGLDAACDQAIEDYFLKPVIHLSVADTGQVVVKNIGNEIASGFVLKFLDQSGGVLQTVDLASLEPDAQLALLQPRGAVIVDVINPSATVNLYPNGLYTIPPPPGRYGFTNAKSDSFWSTASSWIPSGPPPGNIDSGNYAYFAGDASRVEAASGETSISSLRFVGAGWTIGSHGAGQHFFTYHIGSSGEGVNRIEIGYRTTAGVPARFVVGDRNTIDMNGPIFGEGGLVKEGPGTLDLNASNTYSGPTTVQEGVVAINGRIVHTSRLSVLPGATLTVSGRCTVNGDINNGGIIHLSGAAPIEVSGTLMNNGVIDMGSADLLPPNIGGNGVVLEHGSIAVENITTTDAGVSITVEGQPGRRYLVKHSDKPAGPWVTVDSLQSEASQGDGAATINIATGNGAPDGAHGFYRLVEKP